MATPLVLFFSKNRDKDHSFVHQLFPVYRGYIVFFLSALKISPEMFRQRDFSSYYQDNKKSLTDGLQIEKKFLDNIFLKISHFKSGGDIDG